MPYILQPLIISRFKSFMQAKSSNLNVETKFENPRILSSQK